MKNNTLNIIYKGYASQIRFCHVYKTYYGKIDNIRALVTYESTCFKDIKVDFKEAVDDYLEFCKANNIPVESTKKKKTN